VSDVLSLRSFLLSIDYDEENDSERLEGVRGKSWLKYLSLSLKLGFCLTDGL
jgi:hypothetical protein